MNTRYRLLHFLTDPYAGARVPIAAVVDAGRNKVLAVGASHLPGAECIGGKGAQALLRSVSDLLGHISSFDDLPGTFGPYFTLGEPRTLPMSPEEALAWVQTHILPDEQATFAALFRKVGEPSPTIVS